MSARRAFYFASAESYVRFAINLASTIILARLLTPGEIGSFSIAASFASLAMTFRELGVSQYVIREEELTHTRVRAALTVAFATSWLAGIVLILASYPIVAFYRSPELHPLILFAAANFFLVPFSSVNVAVLKRNLEFGKLFVIGIGSSLVGLAVSVALAHLKWSSLSLAIGATAALVATVLLAGVFRPSGLPWLLGFREIPRVLKFGATVTVGSSAGSAAESAPDLVLGKVLGATDTGLFNKALGLADSFSRLVLQPLWSFALPHFSAEVRAGSDIAKTYQRAVSLVTGLALPFFAVLAISSDALVEVLLGRQWEAAGPIARILCVNNAIGVIIAPYGSVLLARFPARAYSALMFQSLTARLIALASTVWFGMTAVAFGFVGATTVVVVSASRRIKRDLAIGYGAQLRGLAQGLKVTACCASLAMVITLVLQAFSRSPVEILLVNATGGIVSWFIGVFVFHPDLRAEVSLIAERIRVRIQRSS